MGKITIGVDFRPALSRATGVGRYFQGLVSGLERLDHDNDYVLFSSSWKDRARKGSRPKNFRLVDRRVPVRVLNALWHRMETPSLDWLAGASIDVAHSPTPLILPSRHGRSIVTICDLFFLEHPEATSREIRRDYVNLIRSHVNRADAIIAISDTTASDVVNKLDVSPERVHVIHAGLDERFLAPSTQNGHQNYLLTVATLEPRKNIPVLLEAVAVLKKRGWEGRLRIAGGFGLDTPRIDEAIERLGLGGVVEKLGYVDSETLPSLYRGARAVVLPSLWEGFGLPLLEAMASDVPLVASDIAVHHEVAGEAAVFAEPHDANAFADAIEKVEADEALRTKLVLSGRERVSHFSWDASAHKALELYRELVA
ncbi:MAG: glycosyltransferase family 1 protein [Acidobacteriota bacterium]|nr:MAG: glycosyltransferase family 1 protein [Acidobacteriota bacterium]